MSFSAKISFVKTILFRPRNNTKRRENFIFFSVLSRLFAGKIFLLLFLFPLIINSQNPPQMTAQNLHQWGSVSLFHGLPSDKVRAIVQDKDGMMWFGTDNGLARYDGRRVQAIGLGIPEAEKIFALKIASDGTLWVGTDQGAARIENGSIFPISETFQSAVIAISINQNGETILATREGQIFRYRKDQAIKKIFSEPLFEELDEKSNQATSLISFPERDLLGTLGRSLLAVSANGAVSEPLTGTERPFLITALERDRNGELWFGTQANRNASGLFLATDLTQPKKINAETGTINALRAGVEDEIWVGTAERGAYLFRDSEEIEHFTFENTAGGLLSNNILAIFIDRESVVWFGTDRGVCRYDAKSPRNDNISEDGNANFVRTFFQKPNGEILIGTNRGLFALDDNDQRQIVPGFERASVYSIVENDGAIYVGTSGALYTLNNQLLLDDPIRTLETFQGKTYAAVYGRGLARVSGTNASLIFENELITALYGDDEYLWIGTAKDGVFTFDGEKFVRQTWFDELKDTVIRDVLRDKKGNLWLATERDLYLFKDLELKPIAENVDVWQIVDKDGEIWGATDGGGVIHVKEDQKFGWLTVFLDAEQGLPSQKTFALMSPENSRSLLIGTNRGITRYTPSDLAPELLPTRIVSQRLHTANELIDGIYLDYPQNSLSLEVTALSSRTFPEQFIYGFILKNAKDEVLKRELFADAQILMEDLPPGGYRVEIYAYNKDLAASEPLKFEFTVAAAPFPWTTTALAVLLSIAGIALALVFVERRRLRRTNRELALARFDLANEAERERRRIARDLHDQTLADLRSLMLASDKFTNGGTEENNVEFRREIEAVSEEIRRICEDLSPSVLENVGLTAALEFLLGHTVLERGEKLSYAFSAEENLEEQIEFPPNVQMQIYRIAQEVLNNISRHANAHFVKMSAEVKKGRGFVLTIEDDGKAFELESVHVKKGRGLANIRARARLIEADVEWKKRDQGGMIFTLRKFF